MLRETFDPDRHIAAADLDRLVVELDGSPSVLDLRADDTLDRLGLDDQISTSRDPQVWRTAGDLGDLLWARLRRPEPAILYRSRTTPQHNLNLAFFATSGLTVARVSRLRDRVDLLEAAITADGFTVEL